MGRKLDLINQRFGRLLVLEMTESNTSDKRSCWWLCLCDCGKYVAVPSNRLTSKHTQSCGCLSRETGAINGTKGRLTHGHTTKRKPSPTYNSWASMRARCSDPARANYKHYGGRGITVDPRWDSFENFLADMGERPEGFTLSRRDHAKSYSPENCMWEKAGNHTGRNTSITVKIPDNWRAYTRNAWVAMRRRCSDTRARSYRWYGAKGITVCPRWQDSFENFLADVGPRPEGFTLSRRDHSKGYSPSNCEWKPAGSH